VKTWHRFDIPDTPENQGQSIAVIQGIDGYSWRHHFLKPLSHAS
jgi:hypothetical protein